MKITKTNKKRIIKILVFFFAVISFTSILIYALSQNMIYFYTPSQVYNNEAPINSNIRVGGMVKANSVKKINNSLKVNFTVHDLEQELNVTYTGILPDLFGEGQGVVMTGKLISKKKFIAEEVLAKHDENYMPPEVADMMKEKNKKMFNK